MLPPSDSITERQIESPRPRPVGLVVTNASNRRSRSSAGTPGPWSATVNVTPPGWAAVEMATPELAPAVDGADIIAVCTGSNAHAEVARLLAPRLRDGQTILLVQGGTGGSLVVRNALIRHRCAADVDVCEMDNYPFSLAWPRPPQVWMDMPRPRLTGPGVGSPRGCHFFFQSISSAAFWISSA